MFFFSWHGATLLSAKRPDSFLVHVFSFFFFFAVPTIATHGTGYQKYRKIPKIAPGFIRRGLSTEGNLSVEIDCANLIAGSKFTVFVLFYFVIEGNFPSISPRGAYIWRGDLTEGFLRYRFGGLYFGRGGLFSEFYGMTSDSSLGTAKTA